jgi:hypothetical protein
MIEPLYFGCIKEPGHFVFNTQEEYIYHRKSPEVQFLCNNDGQLAPKDDNKHGATKIHHFTEYIIIAMWDYSVDTRPGSNSMFLIPGRHTSGMAISLAKQFFPNIWKRIFNDAA